MSKNEEKSTTSIIGGFFKEKFENLNNYSIIAHIIPIPLANHYIEKVKRRVNDSYMQPVGIRKSEKICSATYVMIEKAKNSILFFYNKTIIAVYLEIFESTNDDIVESVLKTKKIWNTSGKEEFLENILGNGSKDKKKIGKIYQFDMLFLKNDLFLSDEHIIALSDKSLVLYKSDEEIENIENLIEFRVDKSILSKTKLLEKIESRSGYSSYISWSIFIMQNAKGPKENSYNDEIMTEMILLEVEFQKKWNELYQISNKATIISQKKIIKLEYKLNSLDDAGDSERLNQIRKKIIESSRIFEIISKAKAKALLNYNSVILIFAIISSIIAVVSIIFAFPSFLFALFK